MSDERTGALRDGAGPGGTGRFVLMGSVLVDIALDVPAPPSVGGDVLAGPARLTAGGGFNVLAAARRQGMATLYVGRIGSGPFGDHLAAALAHEGVARALPRTADGDSGFCVVMVDATGERTMVTSPGVEAAITAGELARVALAADDLLYLSGYDLAYPHGATVAAWLERTLGDRPLILDPGPLATEIAPELLEAVLRRCTWLSLSAGEARRLTDHDDLDDAGRRLLARGPRLRGVIVRDGARGCRLVTGEGTIAVPGVPAALVDATGAGDCHVGVFVAAIAGGCGPADACALANRAAAIAVGRQGPATAPTVAELAAAGERR